MIIYIRNQKNAFDASVQVDKNIKLNLPAIGQQGTFRLPNLEHGYHNLSLSTPGKEQWFMNHVSTCTSQTYLKRRVFKLQNKQLSFLINNKQSKDRIFSARYYPAEGTTDRSVIDVTIKPLKQQPQKKLKDTWTFTQRRYDIRPPEGNRSIVLNSHGQYLNKGESFFIPFKSDMPTGQYRFQISLKQGASGYLTLSQIDPGIHEQVRFLNENNVQNN